MARRTGVRKYHLVDWGTVCTPKDLGGLGVLNLDLACYASGCGS
jgi:hypothetical protein